MEAMLKISQLIKSLPKAYISELTLSEDSKIDFDCRNACYIIKKGELLSYGKNKFTQLLKANDPIGVAETILGRPNEMSGMASCHEPRIPRKIGIPTIN